MTGEGRETSLKELRSFGMSVGAAFVVLAGIFFWRHFPNVGIVLVTLGSVLVVAGIAVPAALLLPYRGWMQFAHALNWFNTRLILILFFYLVITPIGLMMRLIGKRPLELKWEKDRESYWHRREKVPFEPERYEKHF
ncbi:MAG: SxtJ family membrane protein [Gemmatimonadota bacterium]|nr:SxtJ family membrane protein [Gemmatimonadota bacterium]